MSCPAKQHAEFHMQFVENGDIQVAILKLKAIKIIILLIILT